MDTFRSNECSGTTKTMATSAEIVVRMIEDKPYYEIKYFDVSDGKCHVGYGSYKLEFVLEWLKECFEIVRENMISFTSGNSDDIEKAVSALDEFTKNWCMNCEETEKQKDIIFRCKECEFATKKGKCLAKMFKCKHAPEYEDFGSMGDI